MALLPDRLSDLMELALRDLAKAEDDERYEVDMHQYHTPGDTVCRVCFAGVVMAGTLGADWRESLIPFDVIGLTGAENGIDQKLLALDSIRTGCIAEALDDFHCDEDGDWDALPHEIFVPSYRNNPAAWKQAMHDIIKRLRRVEL